MLKYIAKRILIFIPTLLAISLLAFIISISAPADPVEKLSNSADKEGAANQQSNASKKTKQDLRKKLGLDLPVFYFSFGSISDCDTLYKVADKDHSASLSELSHYYGNWEDVSAYFNQLSKTQTSHFSLNLDEIFNSNLNSDGSPVYSKNEINDVITQSNFEVNAMLETANPSVLESKFNSLNELYAKYSFLSGVKNEFDLAKVSYDAMLSQQSSWKSYVPQIIWYGSKNQYHFWLFGDGENRKGVVRGDFGYSYIDSQPINTKIWSKVWISFSFSILSVLFAYIISIPLGIYSAYKKDSKFDRISSIVVFVLYSMPGFFIGVLLLYTFANPDTLRWFPVSGIQDPTLFNPEWSFWEKTAHRAPYFILPLITYTYSSFAFLSRIMRVGVIDVFGQDYIRTARAKGLGEGKVVMKHALRNSLLPIITVFANIFPLAIGGSVIIETIFTIPGMGFEIYNSILNSDYPMIVAVFTIIGFLTMIGYLVADVLYAVVDPRISYK
ncbi:ABC transporter permease [Flavobacteriales bacterium]|jgi:peptide/nickel transport system permease protein|nr:ABC transporter permease [Flavobacteriales bacterium]